jgi:hypothetical protein
MAKWEYLSSVGEIVGRERQNVFFFVNPFYLQSVSVHSADCVKKNVKFGT